MPVRSILFLACVAAGCSKPSPAPPEESTTTQAAPAAPAAESAEDVFAKRCVACHGSTGHGDGPASASLNPKPRQFADLGWQGGVTDDYIEKIVKFGGAAVGKSAAMPSNPDLSPPTLAGLRTIVRGFRPH